MQISCWRKKFFKAFLNCSVILSPLEETSCCKVLVKGPNKLSSNEMTVFLPVGLCDKFGFCLFCF